LERSPAHYKASLIVKQKPEKKHFLVGGASHTWLFEEPEFYNRYVVGPKLDMRKNKDKAYAKEVMEKNPGKEYIREADFDKIHGMKEAISPILKKIIIDGGETEETMTWNDDSYGFKCKIRIDFRSEKHKLLVDFKTTENASESSFSKTCAKHHYPIQAAWYKRGVKQVTGEDYDFLFVAQEKEYPYASVCYLATQGFINAGNVKIDSILYDYHKCLQDDNWPGYSNRIEKIDLPGWY
jgi:hypothetical protein